MTYLNLVNNVLKRLREEEVTTVNETAYSKLISSFVNDAKRMVEDAWDWSALRSTLTVTTVADTFSYILVGSQNRIKLLDVLNDTSNFVMQYGTAHVFNKRYLLDAPKVGSPEFYSFNGIDSNGDTQVDLYPTPDAAYVLRFNSVLRTDDLSTDTDKLTVPAQPVIHMALAMAARERGETGGTSAPEYFGIADKFLSDAIALDAQKHPEETIFYVP